MSESTPAPIPTEKMTQPMGPLEQGDQALADAINRVPGGEHVVENNGTTTTINKEETPDEVFGGRKVNVMVDEVTGDDGDYDTRGVSGSIDMNMADEPGVRALAVSATTADSTINPDWKEAHVTSNIYGNQIGKMPRLKVDRARAQAAKLDIAHQIDEAREHLEQGSYDKAT